MKPRSTGIIAARANQVRRATVNAVNDFQHGDLRWRLLVVVGRYTSHIAIVAVALFAVLLAGARLNSGRVAANAIDPNAVGPDAPLGFDGQGDDELDFGPHVIVGSGQGNLSIAPSLPQNYLTQLNQDGGLVPRLALALTSKPIEDRRGIIVYKVQPNDNVEAIAARFGIQPTTILWSNTSIEDSPDELSVGQELVILPVNGVLHDVTAGDSLEALAKKYKVTVNDIVGSPYNNFSTGANLLPGAKIVVPNGIKPYVAPVVQVQAQSVVNPASRSAAAAQVPRNVPTGPARAASGSFLYPTVGVLTQNYWYGHQALDIANSQGTQIRAADNGYVVTAGWSTVGYGNYVVVDHRNGFRTLYAHMSAYYVQVGTPVTRGMVIGAMGTTGHSTGPHLHFEMIFNGVRLNPNLYLH